jgi:tetratricopeptide (TPR) repeat protein
MSTTDTSGNEFPESEWNNLRDRMRSGGAAAVIEHIGTFEPADRLKLYNFAQRAFSSRRWESSDLEASFDSYIEVARAGIAEALRQSAGESDPEKAAGRKDLANIFSYNLSADLAECWPGDERKRERRHFEEGLRAAEECIRWRDELGKDPSRKSMAQWARGMHLLSLGERESSRETFATALRLSEESAQTKEAPASLSPEAGFDILLGHGYLGIAEALTGNDEGRDRYQRAIDAFKSQVEQYPDRREDAEFGLEQLQNVHSKFLA